MTSGDSSSGFTVATAQLRTHASVLDQTAGTMGQALSAAQQVTLSDDAYGHLPGVSAAFAGLVHLVATPAMDALSQANTAISSMGTAIRTTATNYDTVEQSNTSTIQQAGTR